MRNCLRIEEHSDWREDVPNNKLLPAFVGLLEGGKLASVGTALTDASRWSIGCCLGRWKTVLFGDIVKSWGLGIEIGGLSSKSRRGILNAVVLGFWQADYE